jgi:hypothetical protein
MKFIKMILILCATLGISFNAQSMDLEIIRVNYIRAVSDKKLCQTMIEELSTSTESAVYLAYLGAFQIIWAKHSSNPISKFKSFKKGKRNIEDAVMVNPKNVEIRLLRLSVQSNCPSFLGYTKNIEEDKKFIQSNIKNITSAFLKDWMAVLI